MSKPTIGSLQQDLNDAYERITGLEDLVRQCIQHIRALEEGAAPAPAPEPELEGAEAPESLLNTTFRKIETARAVAKAAAVRLGRSVAIRRLDNGGFALEVGRK